VTFTAEATGADVLIFVRHQGVDQVLTLIEDVSRRRDAVLLCYEDVRKEGVWCHRQLFSQWWEEQTGQVVTELG
jgi:hypothetical protein